MNKTISGENIIGNPSKRTYGDIDTDYDKWCEDGGKRRATLTLEQQKMIIAQRIERWQDYAIRCESSRQKLVAQRQIAIALMKVS